MLHHQLVAQTELPRHRMLELHLHYWVVFLPIEELDHSSTALHGLLSITVLTQ